MMRKTALLALVGSAAAFAPAGVPALRAKNAVSCMQMQADGVSRRDMLQGLAGAAIVAAPALANADVEYANVPYLGGSDQVDVNNANIRVYTKYGSAPLSRTSSLTHSSSHSSTHILPQAPPRFPAHTSPAPLASCLPLAL